MDGVALRVSSHRKVNTSVNKSDLVQLVANEAGLTHKEATEAIDSLTEAIKKSLKNGDRVSLVGFGSWEVKKRAQRNGVNPQTGDKIKIPARKVPKFNPGKELREIAN